MRSDRKYILLAVVFGFITVFIVFIYLSDLERRVPADIIREEVVTAAVTIPPHTRITEDMLEVRSFPSAAIHSDAVTNKDNIIGAVSRTEIIEGEQVLAGRVAVDVDRASFSFRIPDGMRAVSIPVDAVSGVGGYISPGDKVDVLVSYPDPELDGEPATRTALQNVKVLATGPVHRERDTSDPVEAGTITLALNPDQAQAVAFYYRGASFHVALRFPADEELPALEPFNLGTDFLPPEGQAD